MSTSFVDRDLVRRYGLTDTDPAVEVHFGEVPLVRVTRGCEDRAEESLATPFNVAAAEYIRSRYGPVKLLVARGLRTDSEEFRGLMAATSHCLAEGGIIALLGSGVQAVVEIRPDSVHRAA